jgi:hypothetical protein
MPEGILCNKKTVDTEEQLHALLADKSGKQYYEEMKALDVDSDALWATMDRRPSSPVSKPGWKFVPTAGCAPRAAFSI